jgi:hypothetical protein
MVSLQYELSCDIADELSERTTLSIENNCRAFLQCEFSDALVGFLGS